MLHAAKAKQLKQLLDDKLAEYNQPGFIPEDPISIPHQFSSKADIEIMGFFAATLAWGQRVTIINNCNKLVQLMDGAPHDFLFNHEETDLKRFLDFKHRTFNATDLLYFIEFLSDLYSSGSSIEEAFARHISSESEHVGPAIAGFHNQFFSLPDFPERTRKHVSTPLRGSTCKRLNMYLRWMVRNDDRGVDFGIWKSIKPSQLLCPLDVHVERVARRLGLITIKQTNWKTVLELTENLKQLDADDPVKYDIALFAMGVLEQR